MQIESTTDYDVFKQSDRNRLVKESNLKALEEAIKTNNLLPFRPILVNEDFYIIDGKHRLEVARKLRLPIYYIISNAINLEDMITLNNNQKGWTIGDYLHYYVAVNMPEYVKLSDFINKYNLPTNIAIQMLNRTRAKDFFKDFREGRYQFPSNDDFIEAQNMHLLIMDLIAFIKKKTSGNKSYLDRVTFYGALVDFFSCKSVVFEIFKKKLELKLNLLRKCTTQNEYRDIFREMYNWKNKSKISDEQFSETCN